MRARWFRFSLVGTSNLVLSLSTFWVVFHALPDSRFRAGAAQLAAYALGTVWSYFWNRRWTFASDQNVATEAARFVATQALFAGLSSLLMHLTVDLAGLPKLPAWLAVSAFVTILNFLTARYWVFRQASPRG